jgi:hypothetical protein
LRTHHPRDWKLDYFGMTDEQRAIITTAVIEQQTIIVAGAIGCGKTSVLPGYERARAKQQQRRRELETALRDVFERGES